MKMKQCPNGHFFDQTKTPSCPYCRNAAPSAGPAGGAKTVGVAQPPVGAMPPREPVQAPPIAQQPFPKQPAGGGHTVAIIEQELGMDPVVGWLVCIEGKEKGKDFRIHADNNYIGRDPSMDIALTQDETVSRRNHAIISFDASSNVFYFSPGEGRSIIRHNGNPVFSTVELAERDVISIGMTKLLFVPFCGKDFKWEKEEKDKD